MNGPRCHLDRLRAKRLFAVIQARNSIYASSAVDPPLVGRRDAYIGLAIDLPFWLRHNGLAHTLDYLGFLAHDSGRNRREAQDLLDDWWSKLETEQGWHMALMAVKGRYPQDRQAYRQASRLALREADWLDRYVQSVMVEPGGGVADKTEKGAA
jgi:hypothetical protein